jgi:hypothetical protein
MRGRVTMLAPAARDGAIAGTLMLVAVLAGSRGGRDLDPELFGYLGATFVAVIATAVRVSAFWRRPASAFYGRAFSASLRDLRRLRTVLAASGSDVALQRPIAARSRVRWVAHMALSLGTLASFAITLPLVFGWMRFGAEGDDTYVVMVAGLRVAALALDGVLAWLVFHALSLAAVAVLAGAVYFLATRLRVGSAERRARRDLAPLLLLLAVALSGLALPLSRSHPRAFDVAAPLHELLVIVMLLAIPFGKLGHLFIRPLQIGVRVVHAEPSTRCAGCDAELAPNAQVAAVEAMLAARHRATADHRRHCPACKRRLVAHAHSLDRETALRAPDAATRTRVRQARDA